jgi:hypothetical protein
MATIPGVRERRRPLAALLAAEAISTTGSQLTLLALPWFVLVTTGSPARMGVVVAADLVPTVVLALPGGALAGQLGARRAMLACDLARAPLIGWLGPANVLIVDAATYLGAFALVAGFVPAGRGKAAAEDLQGMLAGVRVLLGDRLLRAWTVSATLSQMGFQTLLIALLALAVAGPVLETLGVTPVLAGVAAVATTAALTFAAVAMGPEGRAGPAGS